MSVGGIAAEALRQGIERIERLEEEKKAIGDDVKSVYSHLKGQGFDDKIVRLIVSRRKKGADQCAEEDQLLELYETAVGMRNGKALDDDLRDRLSKRRKDDDQDIAPPGSPEMAPPPDVTIEEARAMGRKAAEEGKPVSDNPFPAGDPRRGAWDEEWCRGSGSDGMEIPEAWRRKKKPKKDDKTQEGA